MNVYMRVKVCRGLMDAIQESLQNLNTLRAWCWIKFYTSAFNLNSNMCEIRNAEQISKILEQEKAELRNFTVCVFLHNLQATFASNLTRVCKN